MPVEVTSTFVEALKNVAEVVAIALIGFMMLKAFITFILELTKSNREVYTQYTEQSLATSRTLETLATSIDTFRDYLVSTDNAHQMRQDRNMLVSQGRFDDIEYLLEGVLSESERERLMVVQQRRRDRDAEYARYLTGIRDDKTAERR